MQKLNSKKFKFFEIKTKKVLFGDFFWNYKTNFKGSGIDFAEIREYIFWDSTKKIDWKTTAKYKKIFIKNYEQEKDLKIVFFLDIWKNMDFWIQDISKKDLLVKIFYFLALSFISLWNNVWVILFDEYNEIFIDFSKREDVIIKTLSKIYSWKKIFKNSFKKEKINYVNLLKKYWIRDNLVFILTDNLEYNAKIFKSLDLYNEIIYINIFDYFENNLSWDFVSYISFSSIFNKKKL